MWVVWRWLAVDGSGGSLPTSPWNRPRRAVVGLIAPAATGKPDTGTLQHTTPHASTCCIRIPRRHDCAREVADDGRSDVVRVADAAKKARLYPLPDVNQHGDKKDVQVHRVHGVGPGRPGAVGRAIPARRSGPCLHQG